RDSAFSYLFVWESDYLIDRSWDEFYQELLQGRTLEALQADITIGDFFVYCGERRNVPLDVLKANLIAEDCHQESNKKLEIGPATTRWKYSNYLEGTFSPSKCSYNIYIEEVCDYYVIFTIKDGDSVDKYISRSLF
uniref:hypothetical protein n=1 Tax=Escherichia coli TaxID=562 RepID=UPI0014857AE5